MNKAKKRRCGKLEELEKTSPQKAAAEIKQEVKMRYDKFAEEGGSAEGCCPLAGENTESFALEHGLKPQKNFACLINRMSVTGFLYPLLSLTITKKLFEEIERKC